MEEAQPLSAATRYEFMANSTVWDQEKMFGCVCDSSWKVGLKANQTQASEWFGADCSLRHCPSGDDPLTTTVETNCFNVTMNGNNASLGQVGNLCHVDCSNRGRCDFKTGVCSCYPGFHGESCGLANAYKGYAKAAVASDGGLLDFEGR